MTTNDTGVNDTGVNDTGMRERAESLTALVGLLTKSARQIRTSRVAACLEEDQLADFAEFVSLGVAGAAANVGGIDRLLAGRPGSWEAGYVRDLLVSTVGWDEEYLWEHRTEPLVIHVAVDAILTELGIAGLFDESDAEITGREDAVGVVYDVLDPNGTWNCSDPTAPPLTDEAIAALEGWVRPGYHVHREPTAKQDAELDRLQILRDQVEALREAEWAAYGQAFQASVLAELDREPVQGLRVPVEIRVDARTWPPPAPTGSGSDAHDAGGGLPWALARLYEAGWSNTPLPGSGIAPKDYPPGVDIAQIERDAARLPHERLEQAARTKGLERTEGIGDQT